MTYFQICRLVRLHEKATRHSENYKKLFGDPSSQSKALKHMRQAKRLYCQISGIIREISLGSGINRS
jgi:acetyl-CoA carboxylase alpha subunit